MTGVSKIAPGSHIELGNTKNAKALLNTGNGRGIKGKSGDISYAGNAIASSIDASRGLNGTIVVANSMNTTATVITGRGGSMGGRSGSADTVGNSVKAKYTGDGHDPVNAQVAVTEDSSATIETGKAHGFGKTGDAKNAGNAINVSVQ